jgi:tetratricopeptide (TPR) repeat protein
MPPASLRSIVAGLLLLALPIQAAAQRPPAKTSSIRDWQPALLERWVAVAEQHRPGQIDTALVEATTWTRADLRQLWLDVQMLLRVIAQPRDDRFEIMPLVLPPPRSPVAIEPRGEARATLDGLAKRVRGGGLQLLLKRGAIVHTDVATLAAGMVALDDEAPAMNAPVLMSVGDGRAAGIESVSLHWDLGRLMAEHAHRVAPLDLWPRDWYRAVLGLGQQLEQFNSNHLRAALRVFPDDPWLLFLKGCQHEALSTPFFQEFARPFRGTQLRPDIRSEGAELGDAEDAFRRVLQADPSFAEARLRLGRVLGRRGRHAEAAAELEAALAATTEPVLQYFAALFLAVEREALDDPDAAVTAYIRASDLAPAAPTPRLALARLAQRRGDRETVLVQLDRALSPGVDPQDAWWNYRALQARHADRWLTEVRAGVPGAP